MLVFNILIFYNIHFFVGLVLLNFTMKVIKVSTFNHVFNDI